MLFCKRMPIGLLFYLVLLPAHAAIVHVEVEGIISEYFDPDGRLPFSAPSKNANFDINMSYGTTAEGNIVPLGNGSVAAGYAAITDFRYAVDGITIFDFRDKNPLISLFDNLQQDDGLYIDTWVAQWNFAPYYENEGAGIHESFGFGFSAQRDTPPNLLTSVDLIPPFKSDEWDLSVIYYSIVERPYDSPLEATLLASARAEIVRLSVSQVPVPASVLFFTSGILSMALLRRRRNARGGA